MAVASSSELLLFLAALSAFLSLLRSLPVLVVSSVSDFVLVLSEGLTSVALDDVLLRVFVDDGESELLLFVAGLADELGLVESLAGEADGFAVALAEAAGDALAVAEGVAVALGDALVVAAALGDAEAAGLAVAPAAGVTDAVALVEAREPV